MYFEIKDVDQVSLELSNPLYYPDDSTPPVPNMTISKFSETGQDATQVDNGPTGLGDVGTPQPATWNLTDFSKFTGYNNEATWEALTGNVSTTLDHVFYSKLNVDTHIPAYRVEDYFGLETYFKELVPATCGVQNFPVSRGLPIGYIHSSGSYESNFALYGEHNAVMPLKYFTNNAAHIANGDEVYQAPPGASGETLNNIGVVDYVFRVRRNRTASSSSIRVITPGYEIMFWFNELANGNISYAIQGFSNDEENPTWKFLSSPSTINLSTWPHTDSPILDYQNDFCFIIRMFPGYSTSAMRQIIPYAIPLPATLESIYDVEVDPKATNYRPWDGAIEDFRLRHIRPGGTLRTTDAHLNVSMQIIGYRSAEDAGGWHPENTSNPEKDLPQYKTMWWHRHFYYPLHGTPNTGYPFTIPSYSGNAWEHLNKLATTFPYTKVV